MTRLELETLEGLLDTHGLAGLLCGLANLCRWKADHLRYNWQDDRTAALWDREATGIEGLLIDRTELVA